MSYMQQAIREWAWNYGMDHPEKAWLLSDLDTWEKNPHYRGAPQPHPEEEVFGWIFEDYSGPDNLMTDEERAILDAAAQRYPSEPFEDFPDEDIPF